jgi:hypothetical protein
VLALHSVKVPDEVGLHSAGEHGDSVLVALPPSDHDLVGPEVDVLDP